jgi:hypothetical protein
MTEFEVGASTAPPLHELALYDRERERERERCIFKDALSYFGYA